MAAQAPIKSEIPLVNIHNASVKRGDTLALKNINLRIEQDENIVILGPNGAGKSTLLKLIQRDIYPLVQEGSSVEYLGEKHINNRELRQHMGIVSQDLQQLYDHNVPGLEVVISGFFDAISLWQHHDVSQMQIDTAKTLMAELGLNALQGRDFGGLSTGQQRRLLLARALVACPKRLILDEPTTGLDIHGSFDYMANISTLLTAKNTAILWVTHHLYEIPKEIERVVLIKEGQVFFDGAKSAALTDDKLTTLFDIPLAVQVHHGVYQAYPR